MFLAIQGKRNPAEFKYNLEERTRNLSATHLKCLFLFNICPAFLKVLNRIKFSTNKDCQKTFQYR